MDLEENIRQLLNLDYDISVKEREHRESQVQAILSLYQKELVKDTAKLRADLAGAMGHMQGCGHTYAYLVKNYPELQGKLTGEQP